MQLINVGRATTYAHHVCIHVHKLGKWPLNWFEISEGQM